MKVNEILSNGKITLSFEVFPPKTDAQFESVRQATIDVAALKPSYMSVTYGAGGNTRKNTVAIAKGIQDTTGVTTIAHLTCVGATKENIHNTLDEMKAAGIENVLALRGDRPRDFEGDPFVDFHYASELVSEIKAYGDFCVGGACYPEGHVEAANKSEDIIFFNFLYRVREQGISVPVIPGIMPITRAKQVETARDLSGCSMPQRFLNLVDRFGSNPKAMEQAGIAYATDQIIDLIANGINHIHVYSMNKPQIAEAIQKNLSEILK